MKKLEKKIERGLNIINKKGLEKEYIFRSLICVSFVIFSFTNFIKTVELNQFNLEESPALNAYLSGQFFEDLSGSNLKDLFAETARQSDQVSYIIFFSRKYKIIIQPKLSVIF